MFFKEGVRTNLCCVSDKAAEMKVTPTGRYVTALMARCSGKWGILYYELTAWGEPQEINSKAEALNKVQEAGLRMMAVGTRPTMDKYWEGKERVQYKMAVEELWVEDVESKQMVQLISPLGVVDEVERTYEPLEMPDSFGGSDGKGEAEAVVAGKKGKPGDKVEDIPF